MNSTWKYLYRILDGNSYCTTNLLYTPLLNPERTVMCMLWDSKSDYQTGRPITDDLINFFFEREVKYLKKFQGYAWAPNILDINLITKKIYIEWNNDSLNRTLFGGGNLDQECPTWKEQMYNIVRDIQTEKCYKSALYPHCFFLDKSATLKTIDFYSCADEDDRYVEIARIKGMIGDQSVDRFASATTDGILDIGKFFEVTMQTHLGKVWADNPFPNIYKRLYD